MAGGALMVVLWALAGVATLLGLVMLIAAVRGRRINDHPICRRCRFDLVGLIPAAETCPECGSRLDAKNAVRVGARVRRYGGLRGVVVAAAVLLIGLAGMGGLGVVAARGVNIYSKLPTAVLVTLSRFSDSPNVPTELVARVRAGNVSAYSLKRLGRTALYHQAAAAAGKSTWNTAWGDLFVRAWEAQQMNAAETRLFLERAFTPSLKYRERVRRGDDLPVSVMPVCALAPSEFNVVMFGEIGLEAQPTGSMATSFKVELRVRSGDRASSTSNMLAELPPGQDGERELIVHGAWSIHLVPLTEDDGMVAGFVHTDDRIDAPRTTWKQTIVVHQVPPEQPDIRVVIDETTTQLLRTGWRIAVGVNGRPRVIARYEPMPMIVALQATVYKLADGVRTGTRWSGSFTNWGVNTRCWSCEVMMDRNFDKLQAGDRVDIELVNCTELVRKWTEPGQIAGVRALFRNVPVQSGDASAWTLVPPDELEVSTEDHPKSERR